MRTKVKISFWTLFDNWYLDGSITIDELIDYLVAEAEELKLDTLKVRPKALTIIPGSGSLKFSVGILCDFCITFHFCETV